MEELESFVVEGGEYARTVWVIPGPADRPHPLYLFLDGEHYLRDMLAGPIAKGLMESGRVPQGTWVFVSHIDGEHRLADYLCNERYAAFIAQDVVGWARSRYPSISDSGGVIGGLSLSALASAHITLRYPGLFGAALCQSGSFWWLADQTIEWPATRAKFWLSVGDKETEMNVTHAPGLHQEISQIEGVGIFAETVRGLDGSVHLHVYDGGHAIEPWRAEFPEAMVWCVGGNKSEHTGVTAASRILG